AARGAGAGGPGRAGGGRAAAVGNRGAVAGNDIYAARVSWLYALSSDGMFHSMYVSNGEEPQPALPFLPANANAQGLIIADGAAYAVTTAGCGGVPDAVWALDLASKAVATWKPSSGGIAGSAGAAIGPDGTVYVATDAGEIAALEPKTLKLKDVYSDGKPGFSSSPVIFQYKDKTLLAAATRDGRIHLLDTAALQTALSKTPVYSEAADFAAGALSSWQDIVGTRWVLAPAAAPVANGSVANGAIVAWKVADQNGAPALQPGWVSRDMVSPLPPMIVNGVVFAVSSGEFRTSDGRITAAERAQRSSPAILYALDPATGKELWSSGKTITSFVHGGGLSEGGTQLYLGTHDGTLYAFGFPIEH
ncbi:MAG TPA: hypothetical protein VE959_34410, partial [Bryobacteraceae bacterium]|nr:hypothetical protein [Bryobacteraceae bacterium]